MALSDHQKLALNELINRGISPSGGQLSSQQKSAISELRSRGIDPSSVFDPSVNIAQETGFGTGAALSPSQDIRLSDIQKEGGLAGIGAGGVRALLSPQVLTKFPATSEITRGIGQGLTNTGLGILQTLKIPTPVQRVKIQGVDTGFGGVGQFLGDIGGSAPVFAGGEAAAGEALARSGISDLMPFIEKLGSSIKSAVGTGLSFIPQDPQHRLRQFGFGAGVGAITPVFPSIARKLFGSKAARKMSSSLLDDMSGELHSTSDSPLQDNAKIVARKIRGLHDSLLDHYRDQIGTVMNSAGDNISFSPRLDSNVIDKVGNQSTKSALKAYQDNPTIESAHNLQSTMGSDIRGFRPANRQETLDLSRLNSERTNLKNNIAMSLMYHDQTGGLSQAYEGASDFYRDNLVPFNQKKQILAIARGEITNPKNISNVFSRLERVEPEEGDQDTLETKAKLGDLLSNNLDQETKNRIVYDFLGSGQTKISVPKLVRNIDALDKRGIDRDYINKNIYPARDAIDQAAQHEKGILPQIVKGGLIRIPEWLIAGTALRLGLPKIEGRLGE